MEDSCVYMVDPDPRQCNSVVGLMSSIDIRTKTFSHVIQFLQLPKTAAASCLLLDVGREEVKSPHFHSRITELGRKMPVIVTTARGDFPMCVRAMKCGASGFLAKPFRDQELIEAVADALESDRLQRSQEVVSEGDLRVRFDSLSKREREVMTLATNGLMNKQIAYELWVTQATVKIHRANAMRKMNARSFAELVRMAHSLSL